MSPRLIRQTRRGWYGHPGRAGYRAGGGQVMSCPVSVDALKGDLLHLAYWTTVVGDNATFVYLPNDQRCCLDASNSICKDDLATVCDWLRPS